MDGNDVLTTAEPEVIFTSAAATKVRELLVDENNPALKLRVFVTGGGCSGFSYGFTFDDSEKEGDSHFLNGDVTMLVDPMSFQYLVGSEVDYVEGLNGSQFVVHNPNATATCGCGSSFSI